MNRETALLCTLEPRRNPLCRRRPASILNPRARAFLGLLLLVLSTLTGVAGAQSNSAGFVYGRVHADTDLLPQLSVTVESGDTAFRAEKRPQADGSFRFPSLPVGLYTVTLRQNSAALRTEQVAVRVASGVAVNFDLDAAIPVQELGTIHVIGEHTSQLVDLSNTGISDHYSREKLDQLPVKRDAQAVALLSAGVSPSHPAFEGFFGATSVAFAGASAGESVHYVNGFNITGIGFGLLGTTEVPYEMYQEFEVRTGGYSAEFGRSLGGVLNAVTRRGTDAFESGVSLYWDPEQLQNETPSVQLPDGTYVIDSRKDVISTFNANLHASGALIEDRLYAYGLVVGRDLRQDYVFNEVYTHRHTDEPFYGLKLDWNIADEQYLEYTHFTDSHNEVRDRHTYDSDSGTVRDFIGAAGLRYGGPAHILRYSNLLTDTLALSVLAGELTQDLESSSAGDGCEYTVDYTDNQSRQVGCALQVFVFRDDDRRRAYRVDAQWLLPGHYLRFGVDYEDNRSRLDDYYSGGAYVLYFDVPEDRMVNGETVADGVDQYSNKLVYNLEGSFRTLNTAQYIEDNWQISDRLLLSLGLRNETFDSRNKLGQSFIRISNQLAPRAGMAYDLLGNGHSKLFANLGRYYLPVLPAFSLIESGGSVYFEEYYEITGRNADGTAQLGNQIGERVTYLDGSVPDPATLVAKDIEPAYQDELILGYQMDFTEGWSGGVRGIYRVLRQAIEDTAQTAFELQQQYPDGVFQGYTLFNPGSEVRVLADVNGDGALREVNLGTLGMPRAERKYLAAELVFERAPENSPWSLQGSYTWAHSYGNYEGTADSLYLSAGGISPGFDFTHLTDGSSGNLPNDHRHTFKLLGVHDLGQHFQIGFNLLYQTGRPLNALGVYPDQNDPASYYGPVSFYSGGQLRPRGSLGHGPSITQLDLSLKYLGGLFGRGLTLGADVFNVLNAKHATAINPAAEEGAGSPNAAFGLPDAYQRPRSLRLSLVYQFQ